MGRKNEVLAKLVCHNLCCVILSQLELGTEAEFWNEEEEPAPLTPAILPFAKPSGGG